MSTLMEVRGTAPVEGFLSAPTKRGSFGYAQDDSFAVGELAEENQTLRVLIGELLQANQELRLKLSGL